MTDRPLTEQDFEFIYNPNKSYQQAIREKVQSAKRLLKQTFIKGIVWSTEDIIKIIDACFQIDDGDDKK